MNETQPDLMNGGRGLVVDCFAGPGGWSQGMRHLGIADIGIEWNEQACRTRRAAGHTTVRADVSAVPTEPFRGKVWGLVSSPPCQGFSAAGSQKGRPTALLDALAGRYDPVALRADIACQRAAWDAWEAAWRVVADDRGWYVDLVGGVQTAIVLPDDDGGFDLTGDGTTAGATGGLAGGAAGSDLDGLVDLGPAVGSARRLSGRGARERDAEFGPEPDVEDERGMFMAEIIRWVEGVDPVFVAAEQVPPVAPLFALIATWLRARGYSAWSGVLNAADYGVPQTRRRAILMASKEVTVVPPAPTHCGGGSPGDDLFGGSLAPWVSMASALGWVTTGAAPKVEYRQGGERIHEGDSLPHAWESRPSAGEVTVLPVLVPWADRWQPRDVARVRTNASSRPDGRKTEFDATERPAPTLTGWSGFQWEMPTVADDGDLWRGARVWGDPATEPLTGLSSPADDPGLPSLVNNTTVNAAARHASEPAPTMFFGERLNTVTWRFPGETNLPGMAERAASDKALRGSSGPRTAGVRSVVRISLAEAAVLQSFPPDYPFAGTKSASFLQVGDAVPPRLAWHVMRALVGDSPVPGSVRGAVLAGEDADEAA